ncbi:hypothetical protein CKO11_13960 [Rhodobacter sp. TJ_12]|uniref:M10 family metallopeptidase C-terminal domain-containing protein n=1 Tax=Rhodobacter sp. TJ_12 TaxID=2029399 RepID=UPI001CBCA5CF|nr:M10 family metallopeptidase C-terminal domain-containing protein [Rhodobacter sp. TJ_12]MBZ4023563.1 hypothetical protein [Rhodobacter sp. TJ_12]
MIANRASLSDAVTATAVSDTVLHAAITETTDAAPNRTTPYTISVGDSFTGTIASDSDLDWVAVNLEAGTRYVISLEGTGINALSDPFLSLYDAQGNLVTYDDDSGGTYDSMITITINTSGTYYLEAQSFYTANPDYSSVDTGSYVLSVIEDTTGETVLPVYSYDQIAHQLTDDGQAFWGESRQSFDIQTGDTLSVNISAMNAGGQAFALAALRAWTNVSGIQFEVTTGSADISFDHNDYSTSAYTSTILSGSEILSATVTITEDWFSGDWRLVGGQAQIELDSYSFQTFIHEIGHALGLAHAGDYNGSATYPQDAIYANDSWQATIMSYFSQTDNTTINASYAYVVTPMIADIIAIHDLYGAPADQRPGDTVYTADLAALYGGVSAGAIDRGVTLTLYDTGGEDTLDLSGSVANQRVDLLQEAISDVYGQTGNLLIARDTVIENAITGTGNDTVSGNAADNILTGGSGHDRLRGENGADTLHGGEGRDTLNGGDGDDVIYGGTTETDLSDLIYGGNGNDSIDGGWGNDELNGGEGDDSMAGNYGADTLIGNGGNDFLTGSVYSDQIFGGDADDFLNGGFGNDRLNGGADADTFYHTGILGHGSDWIQDYDAAEGDVLQYGAAATAGQFQVNYAATPAGDDNVDEAFVIYRPTGQILWALVDGAGQDSINILIGGTEYDLLA